jgi:heat shock protein HslJ
MVNDMNTHKILFPALVAGLLLASVMVPATAFPIKGSAASIEGAGCIAARSALVQDSGSFTLASPLPAVNGLPAGPSGVVQEAFPADSGPGPDITGIGLPEGYMNKDLSGGQGAGASSYKEALIGKLTGRTTIVPDDSRNTASTRVSGEGTVRFIERDGGFYGIITTTGENYLPENLPASMKVDGTRIRFEGIVRARTAGYEGWGTPISLITVSIPAQGFSGTGTVRFIELEGGFFGIVTPAGDNYLPLNLPGEFQVNGLQVSFTAHEVPDAATTAMWGTPVRIDIIARYGPQPGELSGSWSLASLDGGSLIPGTSITATFNNGRVTGTAGCNQYFASYSTAGSTLAIGAAGSTKMYCNSPEGVMEQEALYLSLLSKAASYSTDDGRLVIRDGSGESILVFTPGLAGEAAPLIEYSRTGGIAGLDDHLVISADGTATVTRKETTRQVQVPDLTMKKLATHLSAADFPSLRDSYPATREGADYFTYTLTHHGKTVVIEDTGIPAILVPIINTLNEIVESGAPDIAIPAFF